ncbi:MAG: PilZ domain-containing protein [Pseudomonadota bacterium]
MIAYHMTPREIVERRTGERLPILVPASIDVEDQYFTAKVLDIAHRGVMLMTSAVLVPGTSLKFLCGQVEVGALVIWAQGERYGIEFSKPLQDRDVDEQVARAAALEDRRNRRHVTLASAQSG